MYNHNEIKKKIMKTKIENKISYFYFTQAEDLLKILAWNKSNNLKVDCLAI